MKMLSDLANAPLEPSAVGLSRRGGKKVEQEDIDQLLKDILQF